MMKPLAKPKVWAYIRVSTDEQEQSLDRVLWQAKELAARLCADGQYEMGQIAQEIDSALEVRFNERPAFKKLMLLMEPGDKLIIENKDRLDRDDTYMLVALDWLRRRQITLHILQRGGESVDLNDMRERFMSHLEAIASADESWRRIKRIKEGFEHRRRNGLAYTRNKPYGMKVVNLLPAPGSKKAYRTWVLDDQQVAIMREIAAFHDEHHWSFARIGRFLRESGRRTQNGKHWAHPSRKKPGRWFATPTRDAYLAYHRLVKEGKILPNPPECITASRAASSSEPFLAAS